MILLVHSAKDPAGVNITNHILQTQSFHETNQTYRQNPVFKAEISGKNVSFVTLSEEAVNAQNLQGDFPEAELVVFLSRHSSQSGTPTLTVHTPGNFGTAELGGLPQTLSVSPAGAMADALRALKRLQVEMGLLAYEVSYEVTHHGPSLDVPCLFVELGSSPKHWSDTAAAGVVAQAAMEAVAKFGKSAAKAVLGIGGTHYNQKFTQMALSGEAVFGHMIPKYALGQMDAAMLRQCLDKTLEKVDSAVLDWKGIRSEDKPRILEDLQKIGLPVCKV
jgi:D-aminoacyl-tRNA deacylase